MPLTCQTVQLYIHSNNRCFHVKSHFVTGQHLPSHTLYKLFLLRSHSSTDFAQASQTTRTHVSLQSCILSSSPASSYPPHPFFRDSNLPPQEQPTPTHLPLLTRLVPKYILMYILSKLKANQSCFLQEPLFGDWSSPAYLNYSCNNPYNIRNTHLSIWSFLLGLHPLIHSSLSLHPLILDPFFSFDPSSLTLVPHAHIPQPSSSSLYSFVPPPGHLINPFLPHHLSSPPSIIFNKVFQIHLFMLVVFVNFFCNFGELL